MIVISHPVVVHILSCTCRNLTNLLLLKNMPTASKGVLVRCDPSIRALILQIDSTRRGIVLQELDNNHLMIKQDMVQFVKDELNRLLSKNIYDPIDGSKQQA